MLIKEYRICIPLSVEEYRIAQLYMIQKKSRVESTGSESGVEIIKNEPYQEKDGTSGQYTFKIYHIGSHLPAWLRSLLPQSALRVEEEAWNAYPYTKTIYRAPVIDKFKLEIETIYLPDDGRQENVFHLPPEELKNRQIDFVDFVTDPISSGDYCLEEDPKKFVSKKTGRGPLSDDWRQQYIRHIDEPSRDPKMKLMCAYKLCRVEFCYWGMQSKIERFIHDVGLRKTLLRAHRQAWAWQDEWYGLTIADIRKLEKETAKALAERMGSKRDSSTSLTSIENERKRSMSLTKEILPPNPERECSYSEPNEPFQPEGKDEFLDREDPCGRLHSRELDDQKLYGSDEEEEFYDASENLSAELDTPSRRRSVIRSSSWDPLTVKDSRQGKRELEKKVLILVVHGGSLLDTSHEFHNKNVDVSNFRSTIESVLKWTYPRMFGRVAVRLVACPSIVKDTLQTVASLNPNAFEMNGDLENILARDFIPFAAIPLFFSTNSNYDKVLDIVQSRMNDKVEEFKNSEEGEDFNGDVCIVGDCTGSVLVYDILSRAKEGMDVVLKPSPYLKRTEENVSPVIAESQSLKNFSTNSHPRPTHVPGLSQTSFPTPPENERTNEINQRFFLKFKVTDFFMLGSPLALIMAFRRNASCLNVGSYKIANDDATGNFFSGDSKEFGLSPLSNGSEQLQRFLNHSKPISGQVYNLFHFIDPSAHRIEPLLCFTFRQLPPVNVGRYVPFFSSQSDKVNTLEATSHYLQDAIQHHSALFNNSSPLQAASSSSSSSFNEKSPISLSSDVPSNKVTPVVHQIESTWWGEKRIDYALYYPDSLLDFPVKALPHLLYSSYWESVDCAAFILRQLLASHSSSNESIEEVMDVLDSTKTLNASLSSNSTKYNLLKRRLKDTLKRKSATPNHRANDVIVLDGHSQELRARFMYGPLDVAPLSREKVDVYIRSQLPDDTWMHYGESTTDSSGRASFTIPETRKLSPGALYPVRMTVRDVDQSGVELTLAVLNPGTEAVVFSVDGSFAASVSFWGKDPKVRPGSVDMARHWQDLGYLLIYITARPAMQYRHVITWLAQHNFPHGMCQFSESLTRDPLRTKANQLEQLVKSSNIRVHCAYGSAKDVSMYRDNLGLPAERIFVVGYKSKRLQPSSQDNSLSQQASYLTDGYAAHLMQLRKPNPLSRPAVNRVRSLYRRATFQMPFVKTPSPKLCSAPNENNSAPYGDLVGTPPRFSDFMSLPSQWRRFTSPNAASSLSGKNVKQ